MFFLILLNQQHHNVKFITFFRIAPCAPKLINTTMRYLFPQILKTTRLFFNMLAFRKSA